MPDSHWYTRDAKPMHKIPVGDGVDRPTNLRDAKKYNLLPSVTSILGIFAKHGLETWKQQQVALAAEKLPRNENESDRDYCARVVDSAFEQVDKAANFGTLIHKFLEDALGDHVVDENSYIECPNFSHPVKIGVFTRPVLNWIKEKGLTIVGREVTIANLEYGFGGTMDTAFTFGTSGFGVLDFKTRKTEKGKPVTAYEFQPAQIVAYGATYWSQRLGWDVEKVLAKMHGANVYISSTEPGRVDVIRYTPELLRQEWEMVKIAAVVWRYLKGYDPREHKDEALPKATGEVIQGPVEETPAPEIAPAPPVSVSSKKEKTILKPDKTKKDKERAKESKGDPKEPSGYTLTFGIHKGKSLSDVPAEYASWLSTQKARIAQDPELEKALNTFFQ